MAAVDQEVMSDRGSFPAPDAASPRRSRGYATIAPVLIVCAWIVGGAAAGMLPAIIARKTFLAPGPDAGLGDLGPALLALCIGALGAVAGASSGLIVSVRRLRAAKAATVAPGVRHFGVVVFVLVAVPPTVVLLIVVPLIGALVLAAVCLSATAHVLAAAASRSTGSRRAS